MKPEIKKELQDLNSSLDKIKRARTTPPTGYFARMQENVLDQINAPSAQTEVTTNQSKSFWEIVAQLFAPRPAFALASIAAIALFVFFAIKPSEPIERPSFASIDATVLENYLVTHLDEFDESILVEFANTEELSIESEDSIEDLYLDEALRDLDITELEELL